MLRMIFCCWGKPCWDVVPVFQWTGPMVDPKQRSGELRVSNDINLHTWSNEKNLVTLPEYLVNGTKMIGKKVTANFHRKSSCDFPAGCFLSCFLKAFNSARCWQSMPRMTCRALWKMICGKPRQPPLECTVWCASKKERKNGHLDYFSKLDEWKYTLMIWDLAFVHTNVGYSGVTFSRIPWSSLCCFCWASWWDWVLA